MGMGSVDLAVLWPKNYGQFDVCYKPTSRLSQFASLGIPAVAYPFASYIDIFVRPGSCSKFQPTTEDLFQSAFSVAEHAGNYFSAASVPQPRIILHCRLTSD